MRFSLFLLVLATLAACVQSATPVPTGQVIRHAGQTYPVERLESDPEQWRVVTPTGRVACRAPTEEDCYWSLRAYLQAEANLADLG